MGLGGISIWQLLIVLLIVVLIFGTKKLKGMGKDLGGAVKGFKDAMDSKVDGEEDEDEKAVENKSTAASNTEQKEKSSVGN